MDNLVCYNKSIFHVNSSCSDSQVFYTQFLQASNLNSRYLGEDIEGIIDCSWDMSNAYLVKLSHEVFSNMIVFL